ncbi:MAG TPA: FecR family protein, partial [Bacteroidales bacterium]|nr:FecR family protein [Bacteroidales bacterium]
MHIDNTTDGPIYSYLKGSASEQELISLLKWLKQSKENVSHFNHVCSIWENSQNTNELEIEAAIALHRLNDRIRLDTEEENSEKESVIVIKKSLLWKIAAIMVILIGLPSLLHLLPEKTNNRQISKYVTAIAPKSQKSRLILPDGTKVWLNSGTTLKYRTDYGFKTRDIYLDGEAYFEVAKNRSRPFLVHAATIMVKALGTSFNVKCYPEENTIETTLVEGKVQIYNDENS